MAELSFLLDEHIPTSLAEDLLNKSASVETVYDCGLEGSSDSKILNYANENAEVIVTKDSDFLKMDSRGREHSGIVFVTAHLEVGDLNSELQKLLGQFESSDLDNAVIYIP